MFASPQVTNAKLAQARAQGLSFLGPAPRPTNSNRGQEQRHAPLVASAIDIPPATALSSSAPEIPEKPPRKKSDPVLSSSAPASVEGESVNSASSGADCDGENRRRRQDSRSTGNTRAPSPIEGPLLSSNLSPETPQPLNEAESPLDCSALCINKTHFAEERNESPAHLLVGRENSTIGTRGDVKDDPSPKDGRESKDPPERTLPSSISASTISIQPSQTSGGSGGKGSSPGSTPAPEVKKKAKKNRKPAWYQHLISPTYKSKCADFRRLFAKEGVPETEMLIDDYSCALQRDILAHGRLYVSQNFFCFYANIFKWETCVVLKCQDLTSMTKEKTALVIPNAIVCQTENERYFFTSFAARDKTYLMLFRIWQNALLAQPMSNRECWRLVHHRYGDELGLSTDDEMDYIAPDDLNNVKAIDVKNLAEIPIDESEIAQPDSPSLRPLANVTTAKTSGTSSAVVSEDAKSSASSAEELDEDGGSPDKDSEILECPESHDGMTQYLDKSFAMDIDHLFTCIFTASEFYQDLQAGRKTSNMTIGNWERLEDKQVPGGGETGSDKGGNAPNSPGGGQCKQKRNLTYTVTLNHAMAKSCTSFETQSLHRKSKPGKMYSIQAEVSNQGIPYADAFVVQQHYCLRCEGENRCRLQVFAQINFRKPPWGFIKSMIEKNMHQGVTEYVADLQKALDKEVERLVSDSGRIPPPLTLDVQTPPSISPAFPSRQSGVSARCNDRKIIGPDVATWPTRWVSQWIDPTMLLKVLTVVIAVLLTINGYVLYSYWSHNDQGDTLEPTDFSNRPPTTIEQWKKAYEQSQVRHRRQLEEVSRLVDRTVGGLDNMQTVFRQLKNVIAQWGNHLPLTSSSIEGSTASSLHREQSPASSFHTSTESSTSRGEF
ncbi:GRAM domain-containing protein 1B-like isoform X1 [Varroa destructor]|uniref:VASt domain-containing protein n=1 Tax=Varroa destructor TaxID=109461 RepID=A0A7M7M8T3_VARDE|nr:GRAM domain-containing protein 1B-like isoform X1 [Varroa destructor]XP_022644453.1 GRAM domain-containing protein 1B-like isoform X1 [Varroa destructor]XP_022644463.1 GRAM domain-containing protein 1B-like isoform X1 [Varroa destructor]XP_022644471.1 GRAM domain-containing protein 1B-like isoform X1 [Varroa destructor]